MSDSDSDCDYSEDWEYVRHQMTARVMACPENNALVALPDALFERWSCISVDTRKDAGQRMKICAFWLPILLQREESSTAADWALQIGLVDSNEDLSLRQLHKVETVEAILRALEKGTLKKDQTKHVFWISNMFNLHSAEVLEDALHWLERTGEPDIRLRVMEVGHAYTCYRMLHFLFVEFARYVQDMGTNLDKTMKALKAQPSSYHMEKSEEMKIKGNLKFKEEHYKDAVKFYSKAIQYYPDNHFFYGNRALSYIRHTKYLKAAGDGKRALLIKPLWAKGHYLYCEALFSMGEVQMAFDRNNSAQILCKDDPDGVKDLENQHKKFTEKRSLDIKAEKTIKSIPTKRAEPRAASVKAVNKTDSASNAAPQNKVSRNKKKPGKNEKPPQAEAATKDAQPSKSEIASKNGKADSSATPKTKPNKGNQSANEKQKAGDRKAAVCKELRCVVQDAQTALNDLCSRNAEQAFGQALALVETNTPKELGLSTLDVTLLLYGRASALTEIGQPEELGEAQRLLQRIKSFELRTFQCLVFYAVGRVYVKENRFPVALEQFSDSQQMVKNQITPGKLTWPFTKEVVRETQPDYFKQILESAIDLCKFPPFPDAICRLEKSSGHLKAEIYFTDPDFKGFIQICCCQRCVVEYHMTCWKTLKAASFEKNEKEFLLDPCLTPDCVGRISCVKIIGPTGLVKCKFEAAVPKQQIPKKPKVNQKCTSLKKLNSKEERRHKRKQHKESFQAKQSINDDLLQQKEDSAAQIQQKAWLLYRDRVLLQINQNLELFREEKGLHVSALAGGLKPWLALDSSRGNRLAVKLLDWEREQLEAVGQLIELLLERKNRVWARVLVEFLSSCPGINPKLYNWAFHLNNAGLNAAKRFIERYAGHLEQLDLNVLLSFDPLQEAIIEKLGTRPELFSSIGLTVTDYLKQAPPQDMRLFIWTLEEHRDDYVSCQTILDEYFDMMDGHCSVLKKSDENQNNSPMKSRGRKKKLKEQRGIMAWPGRNAIPRDDLDQEFFEEDSLSFLDAADSFGVPSHLWEQVADFEDQYNSSRHTSHYRNILDNNIDPTKERLYACFAHILEEHGPLLGQDPLLVRELENFPLGAQLKIEAAGGFEPFLLESLRFIKIGPCLGLAQHAVALQQFSRGASLDDLDELDVIADPHRNSSSPDLLRPSFAANYSSAQPQVIPVLPNPYTFGCNVPPLQFPTVGVSSTVPVSGWTDGETQPSFLLNCDEELDLYSSDVSGNQESVLKNHIATQTCQETMRSVAVNTEPHERFESCSGDINKKQKSNKELQEQIQKKTTGRDKINVRQEEALAALEEDVQKINVNIRVTNTELALFQQKLEEEVKKDQKEKKANQEVLRSLKVETEELVEEHGSLARNVRERKTDYDTKLTDFLEYSNQSAAEKMSLEDEIKRCKASIISAARRSQTAQLSAVESNHDQGLYDLYRELRNVKDLLTKLDEALQKFPNQDLEIIRRTKRARVQEIEKKISTAETQYQEQMDEVKNGKRVSELLAVDVNHQPEAQAAPVFNGSTKPAHATLSGAAAAKPTVPPYSASFSAAPVVQPPAAEPAAAAAPRPVAHSTVFDKALEGLAAMFPDYTRSELSRFVWKFRSTSGGSFSSMALQELVGGVTQLILDHQEMLDSAKANIMRSRGQSATPPLVTPVWQMPASHKTMPQKATASNALNLEDPCIICHDDMSPDDVLVLDCRHVFHKECIKSWLREQSTCPTCREHALPPDEFPALLQDDFPALTGRRRKAL